MKRKYAEILNNVSKILLIVLLGLITIANIGISVFAYGDNNEIIADDEIETITPISDEAYLSVHYSDGTMGMIIDETIDSNEVVADSFSINSNVNIQKTTVVSSGKPDNESIVAVFLSEGFTSGEQNAFVDRVREIANYMVTVEPFNYYKDYLTVYAIHCPSNESGISGESDGAFACHDDFRNPATTSCTPNDATFNCSHGKDTFFNAYYRWRTSANRVILEMESSDRSRARNIALSYCSSINMIQIIANSSMRGGTGQMPTSSQPLGVALTSINYGSTSSDWKSVVMHEFGHSFGGLWDEYWNGLTPSEYPNMTRNNDPNTVKWKDWIGYEGVGVYPFASSQWDGNPNQSTNPWFRPHENCMMRQTSNPFCPVCIQQLLNKMAEATGKPMFTTSNMDGNTIKINKMNLDYIGDFVIPNNINGRYVSIIGEEAFKDCTTITSITIPKTVTNIDSSAFENCTGLTTVTLPSQLYAIGAFAFKGCTSLTSITLPESVQHIDDGAFQNCRSLSSVIVKKDTSSITHLGMDVFKDCKSTLQITVPANRVAEYKNIVYWSSYSSRIVPTNSNFTSYNINDSTDCNISTTLSAGKNTLYKLVVVDSSTYNIKATANSNISIKLYDSNMNHIASALNGMSRTLSKYLNSGTYYYSVEYSDNASSGTINTNIHVHSYEYKVVDLEHHILKCVCGATLGTKERHTIDGSYFDPIGNGRYKPCLYCGAAIDTWAGGIYPGIINNQMIYIIYENRLGNNALILSELNLLNEISINSTVQYSINGSYKMPDGTIILVEEDIIAYMNGTLIFYNDDELLVSE